MDIIGHLTRTVTPAVLGDNRTPENENLLQQFYALFVSSLADQESYGRIGDQEVRSDDNGFFDRFWHDERKRNSLTRELSTANHVDKTEAQALMSTASPLAFNEIKNLAGTTPVPQFLRDNLSSYRDHIPAWAAMSGLVPAGLLAANNAKKEAPAAATTTTTEAPKATTAATTAAAPAAAAATSGTEPKPGHRISDTTSTEPLHRKEEEGGSFLKALLPIIGLIILAALAWALLKGCQDNPEPVATPPQQVEQSAENAVVADNVEVEPAVLSLSSGEGNQLYSCRINVGNDALNDTIMSSMNEVFAGEADKCRADIDDNFATDMPAAEYLGAILPLIKNTPNANVIIKGEDIIVNSPDDAQLQQLVSDLKAAAPGLNVMAEGPLDLQGEIDRSITEANAGLDALGENPDPRDVARALSRQVVNFEFDDSAIPDVNKPVLDRAVEIMKKTPDMELLIIGHTDAIGTNEYNIPLSQRRAQSIKDYMVSQGADADRLKIKGMGESDPIATNETDQGRFRNRRIEYVVYDESMGQADENGIVVAPDSEIRETEVKNKGSATAPAASAPTASNDTGLEVDPDLNPLDDNNDDVLPDGDDHLLAPESDTAQ